MPPDGYHAVAWKGPERAANAAAGVTPKRKRGLHPRAGHRDQGAVVEKSTASVRLHYIEQPAPMEEQMKETLKSEPPGESVAPAKLGGFTDFWGVYPKRKDRIAAERAWKKALKSGANPHEIVAAAERYASDITRDPLYTKLPATWLNAGSWMDEPASPLERSLASEPLELRFDQEPEGLTLSEWLKDFATGDEREKAKKLGLRGLL